MNVEIVSGTTAGDWCGLREREVTLEHHAQFALLVSRQSRFVFRIGYLVLRNAEDAEDVVQETFFKLFRTGAWKQMQDEKAYLARMAWRIATSKFQAKRFHPQAEPLDFTSAEISPERAAIDTERSQTIHRLIDALPEKLRRPLALSSIEELTAPEIAALMDVPEGTVRRLLMEARALVKEKMARLEERKRV